MSFALLGASTQMYGSPVVVISRRSQRVSSPGMLVPPLPVDSLTRCKKPASLGQIEAHSLRSSGRRYVYCCAVQFDTTRQCESRRPSNALQSPFFRFLFPRNTICYILTTVPSSCERCRSVHRLDRQETAGKGVSVVHIVKQASRASHAFQSTGRSEA